MKEKTLSEKIDEICKLYNIPETFWKSIKKIEKQFIKEILDEIMLIKNKDGYYVFDENAEWLYKKIREIIKQKSGILK